MRRPIGRGCRGRSTGEKERAVADLRADLKLFAAKHDIELSFMAFDSDSMNSTKSRH